MFLIFALITLVGALAMFRQKNLVVAGLCLVLTFIGISGLFLLLSNPVAAALQIIVYSGAIVVLVLFVIMLLNAHEEEPPEKPRSIQRWGSALVAAVLGAGAFKVVASSQALHPANVQPTLAPITLNQLGNHLFQQHVLAFEAIGLLLLAAMVAAILLVKRDLCEKEAEIMTPVHSFWSEVLQGGLSGYILLALLLFVIGLATVMIRRSLLMQFMGVELMLNAANVALLAFARFKNGDIQATTFYLFIIAVAACEAAVGLALIVGLHRHRQTTDSDRADALRQ